MRLFAKENISDKEVLIAIERMNEQLKQSGGQFTFDFKIDEEGWFAQCKEFDGIVAGGSSKNPSEKEVFQALIDAIKTAFDIPISKLEIESEAIKLPKIKVVRELQFA